MLHFRRVNNQNGLVFFYLRFLTCRAFKYAVKVILGTKLRHIPFFFFFFWNRNIVPFGEKMTLSNFCWKILIFRGGAQVLKWWELRARMHNNSHGGAAGIATKLTGVSNSYFSKLSYFHLWWALELRVKNWYWIFIDKIFKSHQRLVHCRGDNILLNCFDPTRERNAAFPTTQPCEVFVQRARTFFSIQLLCATSKYLFFFYVKFCA